MTVAQDEGGSVLNSPRESHLMKVLSNLKIKSIPSNGQKNDVQEPAGKLPQQAEI